MTEIVDDGGNQILDLVGRYVDWVCGSHWAIDLSAISLGAYYTTVTELMRPVLEPPSTILD